MVLQAQGTSEVWLLHILKHCAREELVGETFSSVSAAKARCAALSNCFGVYDENCDENVTGVFLCDSAQISSPADLSQSSLSCVYEYQNATNTTTTTNTSTTTTTTTTTTHLTYRVGIGVSMTKDNEPFLGPPSPSSVINALNLWQKTVNEGNLQAADGRRILIELTIQDDYGTEAGAREVYDSMRGQVDAFLGPSLESNAAAVLRQLAFRQSDSPVIYWASSAETYFLAPLNDRGPNSILEERAALGVSRPPLNYGDGRFIGTDPDGDIWPVYEEKGKPRVFDVNVPISEMMNHAIYQALRAFEEATDPDRSILFLHGSRYKTLASRMVDQASNMGVGNMNLQGDAAAEAQNCSGNDSSNVSSCQRNASTQVTAGSVAWTDAEMHGCSAKNLLDCARICHERRWDVIVLLFGFTDTVTLLLAMGNYNVESRALITLPYGRRLLDYVEVIKVDGVVEPMVWAPPIENDRPSLLFSSFADFNRTYQENYFNISKEYDWAPYSKEYIENNFAEVPPLAAFQVTAAGEILISALMQTNDTDLLWNSTGFFKQLEHENGVDTVLGNVTFNQSNGKRLNADYNASLARQWHVIKDSVDVSVPYRFVAAEQWMVNHDDALMPIKDLLLLKGAYRNYSEGDFEGLNSSAATDYLLERGPLASRPLQLQRRAWGRNWLPVFPCNPGCEWKGIGCYGCDRGMFRGLHDRFCEICPTGKYGDQEAMAYCKDCPEGAVCDTPGMREPPPPQVGWWRSDFPPAVVKVAEEATSPYSVCQFTTVQPLFQFLECPNELCQGPSGCLGDNVGYMCGQCPIGYSYYWLYPGTRRCWSCDGMWPSISTFAVGFGFLLTLFVFEMLARRTTDARTSGAWAIIRAMYHNAHLMIASAEATGQDSFEELANLMQYFDHTYRPLDLIPWDCFVDYPPEGDAEAFADYRMTILKMRLRLSEFMTGMGLLVVFCGSLLITFGRVMTTSSETPKQREERLWKKQKDKEEAARLKKEREEQEAAEERAEEEERQRLKAEAKARGEEDDSSDSDEDPKAKKKRREKEKKAKAAAKAKAKAKAAAKAAAAAKAKAAAEARLGIQNGTSEDPAGPKSPTQSPRGASSTRATRGTTGSSPKSNGSNGVPSDEEKKVQQYTLVKGPGAAFARTSFLRDLQRTWYTVERLSMAWLILTYAPTIRQLLRIASCVTLEDEVEGARPRLRDDYGIFCDTDAYKSVQSEVNTALYFFAIMPVAFTTIQLLRQNGKVDDIEGRSVWSILTDGTRPEFWWWESVTMIRTLSFVVISNTFTDVDLCSWVLIFNAGFFMVITEYFEPYSAQDRWVLPRLDRWGMMAVWLMLLGAQVTSGFGGILTRAGVAMEGEKVYRYLVTTTIILYQLVLVVYGCTTLMFKLIVQDLDIYAKAAGFYIGPFTNLFLKSCRWYYGLNDLRVYKEDGKVKLDIGNLQEDEEEVLNECFQDFLVESIFQFGMLRPVLLERAINQVLFKAVASRKARIRAWYMRNGMKVRKLFNIPCLGGCCHISMAAPDVVEEDPDTGGATVEELQYAFMDSVADFKMNLQPAIYGVEDVDEEGKGGVQRIEFQEEHNLVAFAKDAIDLGRIEVLGKGTGFPDAAVCERSRHQFLWFGVAEPGSFSWHCMESKAKTCRWKMREEDKLQAMANKFKCVVCGYEVCDRCYQSMTRCGETKLEITIKRGYWTRRTLAIANHKPYVTVEIPGREGSLVRTLAALSSERPVWRFTQESMPHYTTGDTLRLSVRDASFDEKGELGSGMLTFNTFSLRDYQGVVQLKDKDGEMVCYVEVHTSEVKRSTAQEKTIHPSKVPRYLRGDYDSGSEEHGFEVRLIEQIQHVEGLVRDIELEHVQKDLAAVEECQNLEVQVDDWYEGDHVMCQGQEVTVVWDGRPNQPTAMVQYPNGEKRLVSSKNIEIKQMLTT